MEKKKLGKAAKIIIICALALVITGGVLAGILIGAKTSTKQMLENYFVYVNTKNLDSIRSMYNPLMLRFVAEREGLTEEEYILANSVGYTQAVEGITIENHQIYEVRERTEAQDSTYNTALKENGYDLRITNSCSYRVKILDSNGEGNFYFITFYKINGDWYLESGYIMQ